MTFNEAKNLLDMGIIPCIVSSNSGEIDYIRGYEFDSSDNYYCCYTLLNNDVFTANSDNEILKKEAEEV